MSLLNYFKYKKEAKLKDHLPDSSGHLSAVIPPSSITACNSEVVKVLDAKDSGARKPYQKLTPAQRFEIGEKAAEIGAAAAIYYFTKNTPIYH